jgi:hypothetical protein
MGEIFQQPLDNLALFLGILLLLLGLFAPKKFVGVVMDWTPATSTVAIIAGVIFILLSFPQLRFWNSNIVVVDRTAIAKLRGQLQQAQNSAKAAHDNSGDAGTCSARGGTAFTLLDGAIKSLDEMAPPSATGKPS